MSAPEFTGFDVDTVAEAVRQPSLDDLWSAARSRRRRRSAVVAVVVLIALVGAAAGPLAARSGGGPEVAGPVPPPLRPGRAADVILTGPQSAVGVAQIACTLFFTHTGDGGRGWSDWDAGRYQAEDCDRDNEGRDDANLTYNVLDERTYLVREDGPGLSRLSTDHGHTWRDADEAIEPVPAFPRTARPVHCQMACGAIRAVLAVDPTTGTVYRLAGELPSPNPPVAVYPTTDGTIWAAYLPGPGAGEGLIVARSTDRGATWVAQRSVNPKNAIALAAVDDHTAYLLIEPPPPDGTTAPTGTARLLRTTDDGETWTDLGTDLPATRENEYLVLGTDGSLLVARAGYTDPRAGATLFVSRDGGKQFTLAREYRHLEDSVGAAPGRAWLYGRDDLSDVGADHVVVTGDGSGWTRIPLPH
ncbi:WD40/YVTN/BNR-like repeat-containing protein [Micromonospora auratinigra]|uniref:BNR repeat-like domain n=1 Tax=Micromonospora auratinigra TaxID=261654 RepID=A0A1A8ZZT8_9ACTN|nr:sialidase family protein [Micromonospora auratinigra]SBT49457.1 BNR repeat-like domain [Micromonospora auratinigra]